MSQKFCAPQIFIQKEIHIQGVPDFLASVLWGLGAGWGERGGPVPFCDVRGGCRDVGCGGFVNDHACGGWVVVATSAVVCLCIGSG